MTSWDERRELANRYLPASYTDRQAVAWRDGFFDGIEGYFDPPIFPSDELANEYVAGYGAWTNGARVLSITGNGKPITYHGLPLSAGDLREGMELTVNLETGETASIGNRHERRVASKQTKNIKK